MKTAFLIAGALLLILGSGLYLLPYFLPDLRDQYSMGDTHHFSAPGETWRYPDPPLELSEGDRLWVNASSNFGGEIRMYIVSGDGTQYQFQAIADYPIQTNDLYHVYLICEPVFGMPQSGYDISLTVMVQQNSPIGLLRIIGFVLIVFGAFLIAISFLTARDKSRRETSIWQQKTTDKGVLP